MNKIQQILILHFFNHQSQHAIAKILGYAKACVLVYLRRAREAGSDRWDEVSGLSEEELKRRLGHLLQLRNGLGLAVNASRSCLFPKATIR